jgi:hypothetical protein
MAKKAKKQRHAGANRTVPVLRGSRVMKWATSQRKPANHEDGQESREQPEGGGKSAISKEK